MVSQDLRATVEHLVVVKGKVDHVHSAALRDLAGAVKMGVEFNWPVKTGLSLEGWRLIKTGPVSYMIANSVDYTSVVWSNVPHQFQPEPLWEGLVEQALAIVENDTRSFLSVAVSRLIAP